jgi:hypothetical protein
MKVCLKCKKEFEPKRERAKYCSDICRAAFHQSIKTAKRKLKFAGPTGKKAADLFNDFLKEVKTIKYKAAAEQEYDSIKANPILHDEPAMWQVQVPKTKIIRTVSWYLKQIEAIENESDGQELLTDIRSESFSKPEKMSLISKLTNGRLTS